MAVERKKPSCVRSICELRALKLHAVAVAGRGPLLSPFSVSCHRRPSSHLFPGESVVRFSPPSISSL